ncbi:MAG: His/Gly/Thr/Pro-type tRNA ligase C-terminal domain-containing protein, partial [Clostridium sp.]|nr:His/Gly/Thr/Pro-type tRNA ligase C-terminal domain-containing protein [Clostridium sp.]
KIREAQLEKVPYMLVLGEREMNEKNLAVRSRDEGDLGSMNLDTFIEKIIKETEERVNSL